MTLQSSHPSSGMETGTVSSEVSYARSQRALDSLISYDIVEKAFADEDGVTFSSSTKADIFEVIAGKGAVQRGLNDESLKASIDNDQSRPNGARFRIIFLDGIKTEPDRLPITSGRLRHIFDAYQINPRFSDLLVRQHMPSRAVYYDPHSYEPLNHEMWYSAVIRSHHVHEGKLHNITRQVIDWQRFCVWSEQKINGDATHLVLRCPDYIKEIFFRAYGDVNGAGLQQHPMLLHAFLAEKVVMHTYDFLGSFAKPMYAWEKKADDLHTAEDYTNRSTAFLALSRQIHQVATDYNILRGMIDHLRDQCRWFNGCVNSGQMPMLAGMMKASQSVLEDGFRNLDREVVLIGTYSDLYLERIKIGVNECFAMVNQRDAEINLKMASESTTIARASHQDNRSLRIIQILSIVFLPASLVSSVFGMGFFSTSPDEHGKGKFTVSGMWWMYLAISVPLTVVIYVVVSMAKARTTSTSATDQDHDLELQDSKLE